MSIDQVLVDLSMFKFSVMVADAAHPVEYCMCIPAIEIYLHLSISLNRIWSRV